MEASQPLRIETLDTKAPATHLSVITGGGVVGIPKEQTVEDRVDRLSVAIDWRSYLPEAAESPMWAIQQRIKRVCFCCEHTCAVGVVDRSRQLRTRRTTVTKLFATIRMMTSTRERVHVVKCPNEFAVAIAFEEPAVVEKTRDPMQMHDVRGEQLRTV